MTHVPAPGRALEGGGHPGRQRAGGLGIPDRRAARRPGGLVSALTLRPPLPRSLYLETTSRCNSLCETCILTFGGQEPAKDLGWDEFRAVVDQFPVLERVLLHGIGEPLLNRDLVRMVAHLKARGAAVLFNSNAITLSARLGEALIGAGLDEVRVSLDASTRETYARIRGVDAFDKVIANLERFAALSRRPGGGARGLPVVHGAPREHRGDSRPRAPGAAHRGRGHSSAAVGLQRPRPRHRGPVAPRPARGAGADAHRGDRGGGPGRAHRLLRVGGHGARGQPGARHTTTGPGAHAGARGVSST